MSEILELCASDDLSIDALQQTINLLGPHVSSQNPLCVHRACFNMNATLEIIKLLYNTWPGALQLRDDNRYLPIHSLCCNIELDDTASLDILQFMLEIDPSLPREVNGYGNLPIHYAAESNKSQAFCKILIDAYPESLRIESGYGWLPIHLASGGERVDAPDTIQYMLELDAELVNEENSEGCLPIHCASQWTRVQIIEILLKYDPDAASKEANDEYLQLPLHLACSYDGTTCLSSVQILYDAYPEAILARNEEGNIPLDVARNQQVIEFLQTQLEYARQARNSTAMATVDEDGWLPLHWALKGDALLGSIKLLTRANPAAVQVADQNEAYPLHMACEFSSAKVVKYLVELAGYTLNNVDVNEDSPLHYACRGGNCDVVKYLLEANVPSVSDRNNDNKLAIHLLFECGENTLDRESTEYVETIWQLLLANPSLMQ